MIPKKYTRSELLTALLANGMFASVFDRGEVVGKRRDASENGNDFGRGKTSDEAGATPSFDAPRVTDSLGSLPPHHARSLRAFVTVVFQRPKTGAQSMA